MSKYFNKPLGYRKLLKKRFCWILSSIFSVFDFSESGSLPLHKCVNPIQDGLFQDCSRMGRGAFLSPPPFLKIRHTYPTVMKLGTVIPYLRKIQKMYKSCDTPLGFCWHKHFFTGNHQILLHPEIHI